MQRRKVVALLDPDKPSPKYTDGVITNFFSIMKKKSINKKSLSRVVNKVVVAVDITTKQS